MKSPLRTFASQCATLAAALGLTAQGFAAEDDGWKPMFNANDLDGWVNVNGAPETWTIKDGVVSCTGKPVAALRTTRQYENFELELEWRHLKPSGNAGIFVWASPVAAPGQPFLRAIEVQVLDNGYGGKDQNVWFTTHGDIFPIHGATMTPMRPQTHKGDKSRCFPIEFRSKPSPEWNHYRIVANNGSIRLSVNGKEVSGGDNCSWRKGYLGLESEGSPTEWRHIRLKELPPTGAAAEDSAPVDEGWRPLYTGVDLRGWKSESGSPEAEAAWIPRDWMLKARAGAGAPTLWTTESFQEFELLIDSKIPADASVNAAGPGLIIPNLPSATPLTITAPTGKWERRWIKVGGGKVQVLTADGKLLSEHALPKDAAARSPIGLTADPAGAAEIANIYIRERR